MTMSNKRCKKVVNNTFYNPQGQINPRWDGGWMGFLRCRPNGGWTGIISRRKDSDYPSRYISTNHHWPSSFWASKRRIPWRYLAPTAQGARSARHSSAPCGGFSARKPRPHVRNTLRSNPEVGRRLLGVLGLAQHPGIHLISNQDYCK